MRERETERERERERVQAEEAVMSRDRQDLEKWMRSLFSLRRCSCTVKSGHWRERELQAMRKTHLQQTLYVYGAGVHTHTSQESTEPRTFLKPLPSKMSVSSELESLASTLPHSQASVQVTQRSYTSDRYHSCMENTHSHHTSQSEWDLTFVTGCTVTVDWRG